MKDDDTLSNHGGIRIPWDNIIFDALTEIGA